MLKKFAFALFFFLAAQGITSDNVDAQAYGLVDDFYKLIDDLKQVIADAIETAKTTLKQIYDELTNFARQLIENVTTEINNIIGKALQEIKELKDKAQQLGVDITECLGENEQAIAELPDKLLKNLGDCIQTQIQEAEDIINNTLNEISSISDIITQLQVDFGKCGSGISGFICKSGVIAKATLEVAQIPANVGLQIAKASELIATIRSDLTICGTTAVAAAGLESAILAGKITECIANKIAEYEG